MPDLDSFFAPYPRSRAILESLVEAARSLGEVEVQVMKSQVVLRRHKAFARLWIPEQYLRRPAAPLVLTLSFPTRDSSPRWKEIVEPYPGHFTHHLELFSPCEGDGEVLEWLRAAWSAANG
jgi:hypothetical protein